MGTQKYNYKLNNFTDNTNLLTTLTADISGKLKNGISQNGQASLLVSGGSTPLPLFKALSEQELDWAQVSIALVDERWVSATNADSNEKLVRQHLLQNKAAKANFTGMAREETSARDGETLCEQNLTALPQPFDVLILGMGNDGHTASLFPDADNLSLATDLNSGRTCLAMAPKNAPHERMTLTLPAILNAQAIILHIEGKAKMKVLQKALAPTGQLNEMPIRHVLMNASSAVQIFWSP